MTGMKINKTIQAAAALLSMERDRRMGRLRLLKLLYIADRECLREVGRSLTLDRVAAMTHGPVLSGVYDLIKGVHICSPGWELYFRNEDRFVEMYNDPGRGELSRFELTKLRDTSESRVNKSDWDVARETEAYPEYKSNWSGSGSTPIPLGEIVDAVGRSSEKEEIIREHEQAKASERFFASRRPA